MVRPSHLLFLTALALLSGPIQVSAQQRELAPRANALLVPAVVTQLSRSRIAAVADTTEQEEVDAVSGSGLFMGVIGLLGGAAAGAAFGASCDKECRTRSAAIGATIGGTLMIPLGTHIGNRGRGNLFLSALSSIAVGAAGFGAASLLPGRPVAAAVFLSAPIQIVVTSKVESATTRK